MDKSLLRVDEGVTGRPGAGAPRYGMLETIREYGLEQLAVSGEEGSIRQAHATYFLALAKEARAAYEGAVEPVWLDHVDAEHDNMRSALTWLEQTGDAIRFVGLAGALTPFWSLRSYRTEGRAWLARALALGEQAPLADRVLALYGAAGLAFTQGDYEPAASLAEESLAHWRETGNAWGTAASLNLLGAVARGQGAYDQAVSRFEEALAFFRQQADQSWIALVQCNLGVVAYLRGDLAAAATLLDAALVIYRALDDPWGLAVTLSARGLVTCDQGDYARAAAFFVESLARWRSVGTKEILADWLARVATLAATCGQAERAARLFGATAALSESIGYTFEHSERVRHELALAAAQAAQGEPAFVAAQAAGRAMPLEQAVAEAAAMPDVAPPLPPVRRDVAPNDSGLTPREVEVLRLLVEGRSDREIGDALFISHRTVMTHVTNILSKLSVDSRTAAAAYAVRHKLV